MTTHHLSAPLVGGVGLLERALGYTLGSLHLVTPEAMGNPTPCAGWDLAQLLNHMDDSLAALHQAGESGRVELDRYGVPRGDQVQALRNRGCAILGSWTSAGDGTVRVGERRLSRSVVSAAGALEVAVHGWDVATACGRPRPLPPALAEELLPLARLLVTEVDRPARFGVPLPAPADATPERRLLAFLGRATG